MFEFGFELAKVDGAVPRGSNKEGRAESVSDRFLLHSLGFDSVIALDKDAFESADLMFDLNEPHIPADLAERFDVIIDSGTLEHVFHLPNALNNIFCMLKVGGRVIHIAPSSNHIDHGFYMFSPTLFWDYYTENRFEINSIRLIRYTLLYDKDAWLVMNYEPGCLDRLSHGGLDNGMYAVATIVTKRADTTGSGVPQQGAYTKVWSARGAQSERMPSRVDKIANALRKYPKIYRKAREYYIRFVRGKGKTPLRVTARY